jgi:hypothetical protein
MDRPPGAAVISRNEHLIGTVEEYERRTKHVLVANKLGSIHACQVDPTAIPIYETIYETVMHRKCRVPTRFLEECKRRSALALGRSITMRARRKQKQNTI